MQWNFTHKLLFSGIQGGHSNQFKEVIRATGEIEYQNSWINYHSDFLTGTTSKESNSHY